MLLGILVNTFYLRRKKNCVRVCTFNCSNRNYLTVVMKTGSRFVRGKKIACTVQRFYQSILIIRDLYSEGVIKYDQLGSPPRLVRSLGSLCDRHNASSSINRVELSTKFTIIYFISVSFREMRLKPHFFLNLSFLLYFFFHSANTTECYKFKNVICFTFPSSLLLNKRARTQLHGTK